MKKNIFRIIILATAMIFAGYIIAKEINKNTADENLIKCFPENILTPLKVMRISGCKIAETNMNKNINSATNKIKRVKVRRGTKRHIFIDLDNDGIADDRDL